MSDALSARPYAAALLEIAKRTGTVDAVEAEMRDLKARLDRAPQLHTLLTAPALRTGELRLAIAPAWNTDGAVCLRQDQPLPLTVLSLTVNDAVGG